MFSLPYTLHGKLLANKNATGIKQNFICKTAVVGENP